MWRDWVGCISTSRTSVVLLLNAPPPPTIYIQCCWFFLCQGFNWRSLDTLLEATPMQECVCSCTLFGPTKPPRMSLNEHMRMNLGVACDWEPRRHSCYCQFSELVMLSINSVVRCFNTCLQILSKWQTISMVVFFCWIWDLTSELRLWWPKFAFQKLPSKSHVVAKSFLEEKDNIEHVTHMCYKCVLSSSQTSHHYLEQRYTNVMHLVKKHEKFEVIIDLLHVKQLHHTSVGAFFHPRGMELEAWNSLLVFWHFIQCYKNISCALHLWVVFLFVKLCIC